MKKRRLTFDLPEDVYLELTHKLKSLQELGSEKTMHDLIVQAVVRDLDPKDNLKLIASILEDGLVLARLVANDDPYEADFNEADFRDRARNLEARIQRALGLDPKPFIINPKGTEK